MVSSACVSHEMTRGGLITIFVLVVVRALLSLFDPPELSLP